MPNRHYEKGKRKEYKIMNDLKTQGWIVLRTAGSHGFADLIAIHKLTKVIKFIQCKAGEFLDAERLQLLNELSWLNSGFRTEFEVL